MAVLRVPRGGEGERRGGHLAGARGRLPGRVSRAGLELRRVSVRVRGAGARGQPGDEAAFGEAPAPQGVRRAVRRRPGLGDVRDRGRARERRALGDEDVVAVPAHAREPWARAGTQPGGAVGRRPPCGPFKAYAASVSIATSALPVRERRRDARGVYFGRRRRLVLRQRPRAGTRHAVLRRARESAETAPLRAQRGRGRDHGRARRAGAWTWTWAAR